MKRQKGTDKQKKRERNDRRITKEMKTFRIEVDTKGNGTRGKGLQRDRSGQKRKNHIGRRQKGKTHKRSAMKGKMHERSGKEEWKCSEKTSDESGHKREKKP